MRSLFKGIVLSLVWIVSVCAALPAHSYSIERLSLFIYDGASVYEDRRLTSSVSNLPTGLTVSFNETIDASQNRTWVWTFRNTNVTALTNLRLTGFLDADLSAPDNTFFNEYGELIALSAPADHIAADRWEIGEPGYLTGDLLTRATQGNLQNLSSLSATNLDDTAMALSLPIGTLEPDQTLTVTATLTATGAAGLRQIDADDGSEIVFQLYARKSMTANPPLEADLAIEKITTTPTVTVGSDVSYQIVVTNDGPDDLTDAEIADNVPTSISDVEWTCTASTSASASAACGVASGNGNTITLTADLPVGESVTIAITGKAAATGTVTNTATVELPAGVTDPDTSNNTSSVNIIVSPATRTFDADLSIDISTTTPTVDVGDTVNYRIVATNNGAEDGEDITLTATIPNAVNGVTWTCTVTSGSATGNTACGVTSGSGNTIALTVDLQVGGAITIDVTGTARTAGAHAASAAIDPQNAVNDPSRANNASSVNISINSVTTLNAPLPIPTSSLGMLALLALALALAGLAALCVKPMRKTLLPVFLLAAFLGSSLVSHDAKAVFENGNFETGTFEHWHEEWWVNRGLTGSPPFTDDNIRFGGEYTMRLLSIVGRVFDPRAPHLELPREGNFTAKVNNESGGAHINIISQRGTITEADRDPVTGKLHVRFTYAAVLEDPDHGPTGQPYFHVLLSELPSVFRPPSPLVHAAFSCSVWLLIHASIKPLGEAYPSVEWLRL